MSAIDEDEINALETLRTANGVIKTSLENDLLVLRKAHQNLTTDFEVQRSQLLDALLSKDRAIQDLAALRERTGTSESEQVERAKARSTLETQLEEVSSMAEASTINPSTSGKKKNIFSRLSTLLPSTPKNDQVASLASPRPATRQAPAAHLHRTHLIQDIWVPNIVSTRKRSRSRSIVLVE